jgi:hypothetical protein
VRNGRPKSNWRKSIVVENGMDRGIVRRHHGVC